MHLAAGVSAGLVILVMSITGVCLAFEAPIINRAERAQLSVAPPTAGAVRVGLDELLAQVREQNPQGLGGEISGVTVGADADSSVMISMGRPNTGRAQVVYINPYTGEIIGHGSRVRDWLQAIEGWHRWLGLSLEHRAGGRMVTGAANSVFLFLAVSGLYLWWPRQWTWRALRPSLWFAGGLRGRVRDCNWHRAIGFWCAPFLIIITLTGVIMSYQWANNLLYTLTGNPAPPPPSGLSGGSSAGAGGAVGNAESGHHHRGDGAGGHRATHLDLFLAKAQQQVPDWQTIVLRLPSAPGAPAMAMIQQAGSGMAFARSQLTLDAHTGDVIKWEPFAGQNLGRKLRTWARFLHTGEAGGFAGRMLAALASLGGVMLVITGLTMAVRRLVKRDARVPVRNEIPVAVGAAPFK
jgi:uncharacterized iron-regulated membrane protein